LRIIESETAFPGYPQWQLHCFGSPRLQWLGRAGFTPASQIQKTRQDAYTANESNSSNRVVLKWFISNRRALEITNIMADGKFEHRRFVHR